MNLGHSQQQTVPRMGYQPTPIFLSETLLRRKHETAPRLAPRAWEGPRISLQEHPEILELLADERFREELKADPAAVLAKFGAHLGPREVPQSVELPQPLATGKILTAWMGLF